MSVTLVALDAVAQSLPMSSKIVTRHDRDPEVKTTVVRFDDLNLSKKAGVTVLYGRIQAAAKAVCSPLEAQKSLAIQMKWRECQRNAVASAVVDIDHPLLTEHHTLSTSQRREDG